MNNNEPIVLGKVKKGSAGKPLLIIILFLFIGAIILFLPTISSYVNNYFGDYKIMTLISEGKIVDFFMNHDSYFQDDANEKQPNTTNEEPILINNKTTISKMNITLTNFNLKEDLIEFNIGNSKKLNLNESRYYLVLTQNDKEIATIKLLNKETISFKFKNKLDNIVEVKGIIKDIKESEYPNHTISTDESGLGSLYCIKDNYKIEYVLNNNNLIRIKETLNYYDNNNDYLTKFEEYTGIVDEINNKGQTAIITENYSGFTYTNDIDLSTYTEIKENYYSLNTKTNKIYFEMNAKGFDCK